MARPKFLDNLKSQREEIKAAIAAGKCIVYGYLRAKDSGTAKAGTLYYVGVSQSDAYRPYKRHKRTSSKSHDIFVPKNTALIRLLAVVDSPAEMYAKEKALIAHYGRKYIHENGLLLNSSEGGESGSAGHVWSEESKRQASISHKNSAKNRQRQLQRSLQCADDLGVSRDEFMQLSLSQRCVLRTTIRRYGINPAEALARIHAPSKTDLAVKRYNVSLRYWKSLDRRERDLIKDRFRRGWRGDELLQGIAA